MEKKKKIVILAAFYEPFMSGAEQMVRQIAKRLSEKYEIIIVTGRYRRDLAREDPRGGFRLLRVGFGFMRLDKFFYPALAARLTRRLKPDIAHAVMESYAGLALGLVKFFYSGAARILTLQSGDLDDGRKQAVFYIRFFWKFIHRAPDHITAISTALAARAGRLGVNRDKITVIPNGVDFSELPMPQPEKTAGRVICVGRLSWEKGHVYLLKAWPEVRREFPDARLILVGEGPERGKIEDIIKQNGLGDSVALSGNLGHDRVLEEISRSEVFVCPSLAEGLGIVFIEAQACGVPVIGTRVGGIPDVIRDGENGLLVEPEDPAAIAAAVIKLLKDKELAGRLRARALETVKKYDWRNIIAQIDVLYEGVMKT